jgi:DNA-binding response OmpR family regulator
MRILIIANSSRAATDLIHGFRTTGFSVDHALLAEKGSFWARTTEYDLIIIEHTLQLDAAKVCQEIRSRGKTMPIIIIADECKVEERVQLLNAGADDLVTKPCPMIELSARARAILRRPQSLLGEKLELDDLTLDTTKYQVTRGETSIQLTKKEFGLLEYLLRNKDQVISRTALIEHVWDINADLFSNTLETHILNLRRKIELPEKRKLIHTISGRGYKIALTP